MFDLRTTTRELEAEIPVPDFDTLVDITRRRRQRRRAAALTGAAAVVATVAVLTTSTGHREATPPTNRISTTTPVTVRGTVGFLTVDEVVGNPESALVRTLRSPDGAGAVATVWTRCRTLVPSSGSVDCELAIEVTQGDRSSRHMWSYSGYESYDALPGGALFVDPAIEGRPPVLLRADSADPIPLRDLRSSTLLPARPGTDVVSCGYRGQQLCVIDVTKLELLGMDTPTPTTTWAPNQDTLLWGLATVGENLGIRSWARWFDHSGRTHSHQLPTAAGSRVVAADTREAGVMPCYELPRSFDETGSLAGVMLHISPDGGTSWQSRRVPDNAGVAVQTRELPADWRSWPAGG